MQRDYNPELVGMIQEKTYETTNADGMKITIKPIPDDSREHVLDPRFLEVARQKLANPNMTPGNDSLFAVRYRPEKAMHRHSIITTDVKQSEFLIDAEDHSIDAFMWTPVDVGPDSPILLYLHGGGFIAGDVTWFNHQLEYIAEQSGCLVLYPEYRLAPEAPFPGAVNDCLATVAYIQEHANKIGADPSKIIIAGDSAGGSLANACILSSPKDTFAAAYEIYPCVLLDEDPDWSYDYYPAIEDQKIEARSRVDRIKAANPGVGNYYIREGDSLKNPLICAMYADNVSMYPPTTVMAAEYDYLRVQDERFVQKLCSAGIDAHAIRYAGVDHGFFDWPGHRPQTDEACLVIADALRELKL